MSFQHNLRPGELVIDDSNAHLFVNPPSGFSRGREARPPTAASEGHGAGWLKQLPANYLIPRSEWDARIEEKVRTQSQNSDICKAAGQKCKDQNGTNYCWMFAATTAGEAARIIQGQSYVELSPAFAACQIKNFRNSGGYDLEGVRFIAEHGVCEVRLWPEHSRDSKYLTQEAKDNALLYKDLEYFDIPSGRIAFDYAATAALNNEMSANGHDWWSHEITCYDLVKLPDGRYGLRKRNSWGSSYGEDGFFVLAEGKGTPDNGVIVTVTSVV